MAVTGFHVGVEFTVKVNGIFYPFRTVTVKGSCSTIPRANCRHKSNYSIKDASISDMAIECIGPYNSDEVALILGESYPVDIRRSPNSLVDDAGTFILTNLEYFGDQQTGEASVRCVFVSQSSDFNTVQDV